MQTVAARAINEVFRDHIFRLAITFHGGANVIAYEVRVCRRVAVAALGSKPH